MSSGFTGINYAYFRMNNCLKNKENNWVVRFVTSSLLRIKNVCQSRDKFLACFYKS